MASITVAAVQARAVEFGTEAEFQDQILNLTGSAVKDGAQILVFPEDIGLWLELTHNSPRVTQLHAVARLLSLASLSASPPTPEPGPHLLRSDGWPEAMLDRFVGWLFRQVHIPTLGYWLAKSGIVGMYQQAFSTAAKQYDVPIVAGSIYEKREDGIYNSCYVFDRDGSVAGKIDKVHLIDLEKSMGVREGQSIHVIRTKDYTIGACICLDLYFPDVARQLAAEGAQLICAGSTGLRPWPNYPYVPSIDAPQIERAQETGLAVVRAYQCGWLVPGIYMDGLSDIVLPDGSIAVQSYPDHRDTEIILTAAVPLK